VIFVVSGDGKADTLRRVLEGPRDESSLPAQAVRPHNGKLDWFIDQDAARLLSGS
jgi:6-phosphogluconolactonase